MSAQNMIKAYLFTYNVLLTAGWAYVLLRATVSVYQSGDLTEAYDAASTAAKYLQLISLLETLHAACGLVKSGILMNIMQVRRTVSLP